MADATTTAGVHQTSLLNCIQCHTDTDSKLAQAHEKVEIGQSTARSLKRTFVASEACTASGCHDDPAPRITATAELETFNDGKTTVVNPHELPDVKDHGTVTCSSCHKGHTAMEMDKLILVCRSCHHTGSFECGTCH